MKNILLSWLHGISVRILIGVVALVALLCILYLVGNLVHGKENLGIGPGICVGFGVSLLAFVVVGVVLLTGEGLLVLRDHVRRMRMKIPFETWNNRLLSYERDDIFRHILTDETMLPTLIGIDSRLDEYIKAALSNPK